MDYVAFLRYRESAPAADRDAALARRAGWSYPEGVTTIAEYWPLSGDVVVVTIFSTDDIAAMFQVELEWGDVFKIDVFPALSAEDGLRIGPDVYAKITRAQS
jgi:hypothetical protein